MAGLSIRGRAIDFKNDDEYMTPKSAWEAIKKYIPQDKIIWESFYGDGSSGQHLREMGFNVIHEEIDFFIEDRGDVIVSNPPFSCKAKVFKRLQELDKPFILILPVSTITKKFYIDYFADKCGVIVPPKRIQFVKNGEQTSRSWFDVLYICYNIEGIERKTINYL
jgi:hypothetical protein